MSRTPNRPSAVVYRRRRLAVLAILVLVVALVWWLISALVGDGSGEPGGEGVAEPTVASETTPASSHEPTPTPPPTPTPTPEPTPTVCDESNVTVTAVVDAETYEPEQQPQFSVQLENTSERSCIIDVGTASQTYTVMSGEDTIWVSTHCQEDADSQVVELLPDKEVTAPEFDWSRERSSADTCEDDRPAAVGGGAYYSLTVKVGGITSEPTYFALY